MYYKDWLIYTYQYLFILEVTDQKEEEKRGKTSNKLQQNFLILLLQ